MTYDAKKEGEKRHKKDEKPVKSYVPLGFAGM